MAYTKIVDYAAKDALITGNPAKVVKGTEIGAEFDAIATADAMNLKTDASVTITSAQLAAIVTNETGSGSLVFGTSPTLVTPAIGTPASGVLTNCTGLPVTTGAVMSTARVLGRTTASTGAVEELTVTAPIAISAGAVTTSMATSRLIGRTTGGVGVMEELTVGSGLTLSAGSLVASNPITLSTPQASTSGTSITFSSIPAGAKRITVNLVGVSTSGTSIVIVQLGDSGGVETTGYNGTVMASGGSVTSMSTGFAIVQASVSTSILHGTATLILENSSSNTWAETGIIAKSDVGQIYISAGTKSTSATLDRVVITTVNGTDTFDAGEINITYE